ncbi:MAG TPA: hypothetical protein VFX48_05225, partial [Saprospiraceae bacterium]|nr:hypothetical protein [Saprospiraceae bacterium]
VPFNEESCRMFWDRCLQEEKSNSLKSFLQQSILKVGQHSFTILVGSVIAREAVRAELKLEEKIRSTFVEKHIDFQVEVDPELAVLEEKKMVKVLTVQEKWDLMKSANPKIVDFMESLQLKIDED